MQGLDLQVARTWLTRSSLTVTYCKLQLNLQSLSSNNNEHNTLQKLQTKLYIFPQT